MCLKRVKPHEAGVVVRRGRVAGRRKPGLRFVLLGKLIRVDVRPRILDIVSQRLPSVDGTDMDFRYEVTYTIKDPEVAAMVKVRLPDEMERYITEDPAVNIEQLATVIGYTCHYALRSRVSALRRADCLKKGEMAPVLREGLVKVFKDTGVIFDEIVVTDAYPTNKGVEEGVAAITYQVVHPDGSTSILPIGEVDVHPAGLRR